MMTTFYLSRLILDPADRRVRRDVGDVYELHRTILRAFPTALPPDERVLFRLDESADGRLALLVQSRVAWPDWGRLPDGYLLPADPFDATPNAAVKETAPAFVIGQWLRFRLRANPTVRQPSQRGQAGPRVGITGQANQLAWLARKGAAGGFRPLEGVNVATVGRAFGLGRKRPKAGDAAAEAAADPAAWPRAHVELLVVQFDGVLEVTDPSRFGETLLSGIGSAKGFGCGLLSLARA